MLPNPQAKELAMEELSRRGFLTILASAPAAAYLAQKQTIVPTTPKMRWPSIHFANGNHEYDPVQGLNYIAGDTHHWGNPRDYCREMLEAIQEYETRRR